MITLGGNAELELVDSMDPFSEGIIFSVMPPKKSWKNISNLSGGEKVRSMEVVWDDTHWYLDFEFIGISVRSSCLQGEHVRVKSINTGWSCNSLRLFISWMRSTQRLTSATSRSSRTISKIARKMHSSSSSHFGSSLAIISCNWTRLTCCSIVTTCSSSVIGSSAFIRRLMRREVRIPWPFCACLANGCFP